MPVRFICPACNQLLGVSSRKIGAEVSCPKCRTALIVPGEAPTAEAGPFERPEVEKAIDSLAGAGLEGGGAGPTSEAAGGSVGWEGFDPAIAPTAAPRVEPRASFREASRERVTVPRWAIYVQAGVLPAVAIVFFLAGYWIGSGSSGEGARGTSGPAVVDVVVDYRSPEGQTRPEGDAIVVLWPDAGPNPERMAGAALRTADPASPEMKSLVEALGRRGSAAGRTDAQGKIGGLRLPEAGTFRLLVISTRVQREADEEPRPEDLQGIGGLFRDPLELIGRQKYRLSVHEINGDTTLPIQIGDLRSK